MRVVKNGIYLVEFDEFSSVWTCDRARARRFGAAEAQAIAYALNCGVETANDLS